MIASMKLFACLCSVAALAEGMTGAASAQTIPTRAEAKAMAPAALAKILLGDERASRVTKSRVGGGNVDNVTDYWFWESAEPTAEGLCARTSYWVQLSHNNREQASHGAGSPDGIDRVVPRREVGVAPSVRKGVPQCDDGDGFASTGQASEAQIKHVLKRLMLAQRQAAGKRRLPFTLSCTDEEESGACRDGGRNALATLPLHKVQAVRPIHSTDCIRTLFEYPEDHCPASVIASARRIDAWEITLPHASGAYTWKVGLAPESGISAIELERGMVIYH